MKAAHKRDDGILTTFQPAAFLTCWELVHETDLQEFVLDTFKRLT